MIHNPRKRSGLDTFSDQPHSTGYEAELPHASLFKGVPRPVSTQPVMQRTPLTNPCVGVSNTGMDNENADLIMYTNDVLCGENSKRRYFVKELLGQGTFGQVVRCIRQDVQDAVAVKVIKNQTAFYHQARVEVGILQFLNTRGDPDDRHHIVRMRDFFVCCSHLCIVFELLSINLYELVKMNHFRGLSTGLVRVFLEQILRALIVLHDSNIVHCDLKPENVLLKSLESGLQSSIKVIDFGSACFENRTMYSYIQSRFYRSPEVLLGCAYNMAIDMWSLGCIAAELFLGLPLFPGASEHDLLTRITEMLGLPPEHVLHSAQHTHKYFHKLEAHEAVGSRARWRLRTQAEFEALHGQPASAGKRYFQHTKLAEIIDAYPFKSGLSDAELMDQRKAREAFFDFLWGILDTDPLTRWTPRQALQHPFITRAPFIGPFQPPPEPHPNIRLPPASASPAATQLNPGLLSSLSYQGLPASIPASIAAALATSPEAQRQAHAAALAAVQAAFSPRTPQAAAPSFHTPGTHLERTSSHLSSSFYTASHNVGSGSGLDLPMLTSPPALGRHSLGLSQGSTSSQSLQGGMTGLPSVGSCLHMPMDPPAPADLSMPGSGAASAMAFSPLQTGGSLAGSLTGSLANTLMQPRSLQPMGSLEALRGTWHPPHGAMTHRWSQGHLVPSEHHQRDWSESSEGDYPSTLSRWNSFQQQQQQQHQQSQQQQQQQQYQQPLVSDPGHLSADLSAYAGHAHSLYQPGAGQASSELLLQSLSRSRNGTAGHRSRQTMPSVYEGAAMRSDVSTAQQPALARTGSYGLAGPSDWDPTYSDDQLLNEEASAEARNQQDAAASFAPSHLQAHAQDAGTSAHMLGSFAQPSAQGPYDAIWFRQSHSLGAHAQAPPHMQPGQDAPQLHPSQASEAHQLSASLGYIMGEGASAWPGDLDLQTARQTQQLLDARLARMPQQPQTGHPNAWPSFLASPHQPG